MNLSKVDSFSGALKGKVLGCPPLFVYGAQPRTTNGRRMEMAVRGRGRLWAEENLEEMRHCLMDAGEHNGLKSGEADHRRETAYLAARPSIICLYNMSHILYHQHGSQFAEESIPNHQTGLYSAIVDASSYEAVEETIRYTSERADGNGNSKHCLWFGFRSPHTTLTNNLGIS